MHELDESIFDSRTYVLLVVSRLWLGEADGLDFLFNDSCHHSVPFDDLNLPLPLSLIIRHEVVRVESALL